MFSEENFGVCVDQMAMGEMLAQTEGVVCSWLVGVLTLYLFFKVYLFILSNLYTRCGAQIHDSQIKSPMLFGLSQPDTPLYTYYLPFCLFVHYLTPKSESVALKPISKLNYFWIDNDTTLSLL